MFPALNSLLIMPAGRRGLGAHGPPKSHPRERGLLGGQGSLAQVRGSAAPKPGCSQRRCVGRLEGIEPPLHPTSTPGLLLCDLGLMESSGVLSAGVSYKEETFTRELWEGGAQRPPGCGWWGPGLSDASDHRLSGPAKAESAGA